MYTTRQQIVSALATLIFLALGTAAVLALFGGFSTVTNLIQSGSQQVSGAISLAVLAALLFLAFQQIMLRVIIFRK